MPWGMWQPRREVSTFTQPTHADRLVPLNVQELTSPIAGQTKVILEGIHPGRNTAQAVDGRVRIELSDKNREEMFIKTYKRMNVTMDDRRGIWIDLAQFDHYFDD